MHYLEPIAQRFGLSVADLRRIVFEHCGIPKDAPDWAVDCWLHQILSTAAATPVSDFPADETGLLKAIDQKVSCQFAHGSFMEKRAASLHYHEVQLFLEHCEQAKAVYERVPS